MCIADVLRAAVRALLEMTRIEGADTHSEFINFYQRVLKTPLLAKMLEDMHT